MTAPPQTSNAVRKCLKYQSVREFVPRTNICRATLLKIIPFLSLSFHCFVVNLKTAIRTKGELRLETAGQESTFLIWISIALRWLPKRLALEFQVPLGITLPAGKTHAVHSCPILHDNNGQNSSYKFFTHNFLGDACLTAYSAVAYAFQQVKWCFSRTVQTKAQKLVRETQKKIRRSKIGTL